ncbi:MAG: AraC family transcriptional regulator [Acidobacteriota bacterium]
MNSQISGDLPFRVSKRREMEGLVLLNTVYQAGSRLPRHRHERARFVVVLQGSFQEMYEQQSRICRPATLIIRPPLETHSENFSEAAICISIEVGANWEERLNERAGLLNASHDLRSNTISQLGLKLHREMYQTDDASHMAIEALVLEMAVEAARRREGDALNQSPRWLDQAKELLHARFPERLTIAELARAVDAHPTHLARAFRRRFGCTIGEYARHLRVEFACREILKSDLPLAQIASIAGFSDQSHFSRVFKRLTGLTPCQYRSRAR